MNDIESAIEVLKTIEVDEDDKELEDSINLAISALEKQCGWIPVWERFPKYDGTYYCTVKVIDGVKGMQAGSITGIECVYVNGIWKNVWFQEISHIYKVIAWQPLPEPYKEVENEN